jgi:hypothetical protein
MRKRHMGRYVLATAVVLAVGVPSVAMGFGEGTPLRLGERNPGQNPVRDLVNETEIIADLPGYATRQSNKRVGAGGGAIYGCRANATAPQQCIRAVNLSDGAAFGFSTNGKEGGRITVGDPAGKPFTTNATGVATGLNADRVDGKEAADFAAAGDIASATVNADGTLVRGRGATASSRTDAAGQTYVVTFSRDVSLCAFTANVVGGSADFTLGVQAGPQPTQVTVDERNAADGNTDGRGFMVQAVC